MLSLISLRLIPTSKGFFISFPPSLSFSLWAAISSRSMVSEDTGGRDVNACCAAAGPDLRCGRYLLLHRVLWFGLVWYGGIDIQPLHAPRRSTLPWQ